MKIDFMIIFKALKESTENVDSDKLSNGVEASNKVLDGTASIGDIETMCSIAHKIIEPDFDKEEVAIDYSNYFETSPHKWVKMINCELDEEWGTIARAVVAYNS